MKYSEKIIIKLFKMNLLKLIVCNIIILKKSFFFFFNMIYIFFKIARFLYKLFLIIFIFFKNLIYKKKKLNQI
jgi:hypothetical protein